MLNCGFAIYNKLKFTMRLAQVNGWIEGPNVRFRAEHPVLAAHLVGERVIVLYDYMAFPKNEPARNLFCYNSVGTQIWRAPDIGMGGADGYTNITSEVPLRVGNFAGFNCRIDEQTGDVLEKSFTK
jgi:hypothetical protein